MLEYDEDDLQTDYDYFFEKYEPVSYEVNDENRTILKDIDSHLVWTAHSTCENDFISPGFLEFSPSSCCWAETEWYVTKTPWESDNPDNWVQVSGNFPCPECNPDNDEEMEQSNEDCTICEGNAFYTYYAD